MLESLRSVLRFRPVEGDLVTRRLAGAACVAIVTVPVDWPEAWDLADPLPEGATAQTLAAMLADAERAAADPEAVTAEFRAAEI